MMRPRMLELITAITCLVAVGGPVQLNGQNNPAHNQKHHHYKLIDMGTFGGPQSYVVEADFTAEADVNNQGVLTGWADTPDPDPYPNFCFWDCFIVHTFQWKNGVRTDLGVLPGGASSQPSWISRSGLISGWSQNGEIDPLVTGFPEDHAVLWKGGSIQDLGTLPEGGYESLGFGVNRSGRVVGLATNTVPDANSMLGFGYEARAFVWDQNHGMQDIGTLGGTDAQALLVNDRGEVVGWSYTSSAPSAACAADMLGLSLTTGSFIWDKKNGMVNLGGFGGTCTLANDVNDQGQVVGGSFVTGDQFVHPFLWDRSNGLMELGTLGGDDGTSFAINDRGEAVGGSELKGDVQIDAALWANGRVTDLGQLAGGCGSYALWINNPGQVVGNAFGCSDESLTGFLWESGGPMVDLNSLIVPPSSLFVVQAYTINDRGEIAGKGVFPHGAERAVLLIPCDENHPGVERCDYSLVEAAAATRESSVSAMHTADVSAHAPFGRRGLPFSPRRIGAQNASGR